MTPEQVTKRKSWAYALVAGGIACFITAYQYAQPVVGRGEPPPDFAPYLFGGIGIVCLIVGGLLALQLKKEPTPAATTDLSSPRGKTVIRLMIAGAIALVALTFVNIMAPEDDVRWLVASGVLLVIMAVCFVTAGKVARNIRRDTAAGAGK
jgi:hypothetical protein